MTSIQLYKFIHTNSIEWRWETNGKERDVLLFIPMWAIQDFNNLLPPTFFDDGGYQCTMMHEYFCFWIKDLSGYFDIDITELFGNDPNQT